MQMKKAVKLNNKNGHINCEHKNLSKEYHLGAATGDFVCTCCGKSGFGRDWPNKNKGKGEKGV